MHQPKISSNYLTNKTQKSPMQTQNKLLWALVSSYELLSTSKSVSLPKNPQKHEISSLNQAFLLHLSSHSL